MNMANKIEELKRLNLAEFLTRLYGLEFQQTGNEYVCSSPFSEDRDPSFFVRLVEGHWLFKCFSSGHGGSIIDFVQIKENLSSPREALKHLGSRLSSSEFLQDGQKADNVSTGGKRPGSAASYDIFKLYERFRREDTTACRSYLLGRGIAEALVDELVSEGSLVHNRWHGHSYCCFVVRNSDGELMSLDNHQIDGKGKFVLGCKTIYTRDWEQLPEAEIVFVCEGVIDYLSVKTLESSPLPGFALLGNHVNVSPSLLVNARRILSALDDDPGGYSAILDIQDLFPDKEIAMYDLKGHKDPNELLMARAAGKRKHLSPEEKLRLYHEFLRASNKSELARRWEIDRSYLYDIVKDCDGILLDVLSERKAGRKPADKPRTLQQAWEQIGELEQRHDKEATEREKLYCRNEFLQLRLKWSEIEAAKLRGEPVDDTTGPKKKGQIKKNVKRLFVQEAFDRKLFESRSGFEHITPEGVGQIWAEDFTDLPVCGQTFKLALLIDVFDQYKLGVAVGCRADNNLVAEPVCQALAENGGQGPERFLLSDNGSQYVSDQHGQTLSTAQIVQRCIPACTPQYNGWVECENKEFKNVFYNVWERRERQGANKGKNLLGRVEAAVKETTHLLNEVVPRPALGGVTPADVHHARDQAKRMANRAYYEKARKEQTAAPWSRGYWDVLKANLKATSMSAKEVMTKLAFFLPKPLKRIANLNTGGVG